MLTQGQARGYGRITQKRGRTSGGHYFQDLFTAKPLDTHHFLGYKMKDLDIIFKRIPHNTMWVHGLVMAFVQSWVVFDLFL